MRKIKFFMALTAILLFVSCSPDKNNDLLYSCDQPNRTVNIPYLITESEAYSEIITLANELQGEWERCPNVYNVTSIESVSSELLMPYLSEIGIEIDENMPNNILYIFNFGEGYAIAAADRRFNETVFAIAEKGSLSPNDLAHREPIGIDGLQDGDDGELHPVSISTIINGKIPYSATQLIMHSVATHYSEFFFENYYYGGWEVDSTTMIVLSPELPKYDQESPFNDSCPIINDSVTPAGCGPIALLTIMANNSSTTFNFAGLSVEKEHIINYNNYADETYSLLAYYARQIGKAVKTTYTPTGSSTARRNLIRFMSRTLNYEHVDDHDFDASIIKSMLNDSLPIIMEGWGSGGHYFMIEGMQYQRRRIYFNNENDQNYYHSSRIRLKCNFGWKGDGDGWYLKSIDNVITENGEVHYYSDRQKIISYSTNQ